MSRLATLFDALCNLCAIAAGCIVLAIMIAVSADVLLRYLFAMPLSWVLQFTEYGLLYIVFLGMPWLQRERGHVTVDLLTSQLPATIATLLGRAVSILGAMAFAIIAWYGAVVTAEQFIDGTMTADFIGVHRYLVTMVIPFGAAMLSVQFLRQV